MTDRDRIIRASIAISEVMSANRQRKRSRISEKDLWRLVNAQMNLCNATGLLADRRTKRLSAKQAIEQIDKVFADDAKRKRSRLTAGDKEAIYDARQWLRQVLNEEVSDD